MHLTDIQGNNYKEEIQIFITFIPALMPSVLGHIFTTSFGCGWAILFILGRICEGQKINGQSVPY